MNRILSCIGIGAITLASLVTNAEEPPKEPQGGTIYVLVSERALSQLMNEPVVQRTEVRDTIVGTPVEGIANTTGKFSVRLAPGKKQAIVDLVFQGNVQAESIGFGGPVQVHSDSVTRFIAIKRLLVDGKGVEALPAEVSAGTTIAIGNVTTHLPGLRGRIVRRIGSRRAAEMKAAAATESANKVELHIARHLDDEVEKKLLKPQGRISQLLAAFSVKDANLPTSIEFATSEKYLHVAIHRGGGARNESRTRPNDGPALANRPTPPPSKRGTGGIPDVVVHVPSSLVKRLAPNTDLDGMVAFAANMLLPGRVEQYVGLSEEEPSAKLNQSADGQWWTLTIPEVKMGK